MKHSNRIIAVIFAAIIILVALYQASVAAPNLSITRWGDMLSSIPTDSSEGFEASVPPAAWTHDYGYSTQSSTWKKSGSYSVKMETTDLNAHGAYKTFTPASAIAGWQVSAWAFVESIQADNKIVRLFWGGSIASVSWAAAGVKRVSGKYYPVLCKYVGGETFVVSSREIDISVQHYFQLVVEDGGMVNLLVDGIWHASGVGVGAGIDTYGYGGYTGNDVGVSVSYVDDLKVWKRVLRIPMHRRVDSTTLVAAATLKDTHAATNGVVELMKSTDNGVTWTLKDSISPGGYGGDCYGIVKVGSSYYAFLLGLKPTTYATYIYKSIDAGETWTLVYSHTVGILQPDAILSGTKILTASWTVTPTWRVNSAWFETADNTLTETGRIATRGDDGLYDPSEVSFWRNPTNGRLRCFCRWDDPTTVKQTWAESPDDGVTWGSHTLAWADTGGMLRSAWMTHELYATGYTRTGTGAAYSKVWRFDPDTVALIGSVETPFDGGSPPSPVGGEVSNGWIGTGSAYNLVDVTLANRTAMYYELQSSSETPAATGPDEVYGWGSKNVNTYGRYPYNAGTFGRKDFTNSSLFRLLNR